jgi:hypothetical protein
MTTPPPILRDPQLGLFEAKPGDANVVWLELLLKNSTDWLTARQIIASCFGKLHDRDVRELASASKWIISGQRGYKHIEHATAEESAHAANWLISQGKKMIKRGIGIRQNAHKLLG